MDQQQHYHFHPEDIHFRGTNISLSSIYAMVTTASGNPFILDDHLILDAAGSRGDPRFPHPPISSPLHHGFRRQILPVQFHHPRLPADGFAVGSRGSVLPPLYRHMLQTTLRNQNFGPMGFINVDDVTLLVGHSNDMRNDIEDMSYEELLALSERIGNVTTGLSEEMIVSQMMTKAASVEQETDSCVICQEEYKKGEKIGILQCRHEYHADCLRKWLLEKNVCPMCKSEALTLGGNSV